MLIRESISFQRGVDPKKILGIGFPMEEIFKALQDLVDENYGLSNIEEIKLSEHEMGYSIESNEHHSETRVERWLYTLTYSIIDHRYIISGTMIIPINGSEIGSMEVDNLREAILILKQYISL
jgi:hypothetical protein